MVQILERDACVRGKVEECRTAVVAGLAWSLGLDLGLNPLGEMDTVNVVVLNSKIASGDDVSE